MNKNEIHLWNRIKQGDTFALGDLYELYIDQLFAYGISVAGNRGFVMDCIHDLFVDLYKYKSKLADTNNVKFYLFQSLKRKLYKEFKGNLVFQDDPKFLEDFLGENVTMPYENDIIEREIVNERNVTVFKMLEALSKKQRLGLSLRFEQNKSYKEIAEILKISESSARTTIYRAVKELRKRSCFFMLVLILLSIVIKKV